MAQNLLQVIAINPDIHENKFHMLWNGILNYHFPVTVQYGVAPQTSVTGLGSKPEFFVVKVAREEESIVLVVELRKPAEDSDAGRTNVKQELTDYIEERFDETEFDTIYAIGGIGLSWSAYKMQKAGSPELECIYGWASNVTSATSFSRLANIARWIDEMTGTVRE